MKSFEFDGLPGLIKGNPNYNRYIIYTVVFQMILYKYHTRFLNYIFQIYINKFHTYVDRNADDLSDLSENEARSDVDLEEESEEEGNEVRPVFVTQSSNTHLSGNQS